MHFIRYEVGQPKRRNDKTKPKLKENLIVSRHVIPIKRPGYVRPIGLNLEDFNKYI
jgi:hypothetical protein